MKQHYITTIDSDDCNKEIELKSILNRKYIIITKNIGNLKKKKKGILIGQIPHKVTEYIKNLEK